MRIAIFGGSFNPVHIGHVIIAKTVAESGLVDEVWMMVSPENPLKSGKRMLGEEERFRLVGKTLKDCKGVKASDFEFSLPRPTFTYHTLCELKKRYPKDEFMLLIGSDNWELFNKWRDPERILREFGVIIYQRPDVPVKGPFPKGVEALDGVPMVMLSSTYIRESLEKGRDIRYLVPAEVYEDIEKLKDKILGG